MNILATIGKGLIGLIFASGSLFSPHATDQSAILKGINPTGGGTYRLQSSISSTQTSITLSSFKEPVSGTLYTMAYLNSSIEYGTLDPQTSNSEFISFTGITQNSDGTATLTGVTRGLSRSYPYTSATTYKLTHSGQSIFILSNTPQLYASYANKSNSESITGQWTFASTSPALYDGTFSISTSSLQIPYASWIATVANVASTSAQSSVLSGTNTWTGSNTFSALATFSSGLTSAGTITSNGSATFNSTTQVPYSSASSSAASVGYVNGVAVAGSPNSATTTKGIIQLATRTDLASSTYSGSTGAILVTPTFYATSSYGIATTSTVITGTDGLIANSLLQPQVRLFGGTSADGDLTVSSGTTTIDLSGNRVFVKNYRDISITGTGHVAFTNANATGTLVWFKGRNWTLTCSPGPCISVEGLGPQSLTATTTSIGATGTPAVIGLFYSNPGGGGWSGGSIAGTSTTQSYLSSNIFSPYAFVPYPFFMGASGGNGTDDGGGTPGTGGQGGGAFIGEVGGIFNCTATPAVSVRGGIGGNGTAVGASNDKGGGAGASGFSNIFYRPTTVTANTCTFDTIGNNGGKSGIGNSGSGTFLYGGAGGANPFSSGSGGSNSNTVGARTGGDGGQGYATTTPYWF